MLELESHPIDINSEQLQTRHTNSILFGIKLLDGRRFHDSYAYARQMQDHRNRTPCSSIVIIIQRFLIQSAASKLLTSAVNILGDLQSICQYPTKAYQGYFEKRRVTYDQVAWLSYIYRWLLLDEPSTIWLCANN
jgi:hypothetical protein